MIIRKTTLRRMGIFGLGLIMAAGLTLQAGPMTAQAADKTKAAQSKQTGSKTETKSADQKASTQKKADAGKKSSGSGKGQKKAAAKTAAKPAAKKTTASAQSTAAAPAAAAGQAAAAASAGDLAVSADAALTGQQAVAAVGTYSKEEEAAHVQMLQATLESTGVSRVTNYSQVPFNMTSMAGGVEVRSAFPVTMSGAQAAGGQVMAAFPYRAVMNGRTLRKGESLQALMEMRDGSYTGLATVLTPEKVSVSLPFTTGGSACIVFVPTRIPWQTGTGYDYLAMGNSITIHPVNMYWPDAMGMGATSQTKDYFHQVEAGLTTVKGKQGVNALAMNLALWEVSAGNRKNVLPAILPYVHQDLDLITVQIGENVPAGDPTFAADFAQLMATLKNAAPHAQLVVVGTFWDLPLVEAAKLAGAAAVGADYVDISAIRGKSQYLYGAQQCVNADGQPFYSNNPGTALHPNDAAMAVMAADILQVIR